MNGVLDASMRWMDALWDEDAALLWTVRGDRHMTRDTAWYALGLLQRRAEGDIERARRAINAVIACQFPVDGSPYDGTFRRAPEEPDPPDEPVMWVHYDPNWRWFIGCTFAVACDRFADDLGPALEERMREAIARAVEGEPEGRVAATYANIALMKAWLEAWSGKVAGAETFAREVASHFAEHDAFVEYNSPTYYGIDLWALALWRGATPVLSELGARIEEALWRDVARFYHATLRNLCGPHDRAYGMDMCTHATPLGLWVWQAVGRERAPFPDTTTRFRHPHDICFGPCVSLFDAQVPGEAVAHLSAFRGERFVERRITTEPLRVATAWLADDVMLGGWTGPSSGIGWFQHHHATVHWRRPDGGVGWLRLRPDVAADATASPGELAIEARSPALFDAHPGIEVEGDAWSSDGIVLHADTGGAARSADAGVVVGADGPVTLTLRYGGRSRA